MYGLLITISIIIAVFLVIAVLLQASKGEGLAGTFGGGGGQMNSMFGARRTADFLSRITWWLGGSLIVFAVVINMFFLPGQATQEQRESVIQSSRPTSVPSNPTLPDVPAETPTETPAPTEGGTK
ncbi:MAG: preprotein translocase subunit SecG [Melioribacteraceae bacterium]|nr:preprotein translocase subunit SecG [Melioribacteraceae bacterium]